MALILLTDCGTISQMESAVTAPVSGHIKRVVVHEGVLI